LGHGRDKALVVMDIWGLQEISMLRIRVLIIKMVIIPLVHTTGHHRQDREDSLALDLQVQG
jgi:hypothetical protein